MSGEAPRPDTRPEGPASSAPPGPLPPLVLRCRLSWRLISSLTALLLLALGAEALGESMADPAADTLTFWTPPILLAGGALCAYFAARYCLATLTLDDSGFRLSGPLGRAEVAWTEIAGWARVPGRFGPGVLRVVVGADRRRLTVPLIYEDTHLLEAGIAERRFPSC